MSHEEDRCPVSWGSDWVAGVCLTADWSPPTTSMKFEIHSKFHLTDWELKVDHLEELSLKLLNAIEFSYILLCIKSGLF